MELKGIIEIDGRKSEFNLDAALGSYFQWGADTSVLGERVDLLTRLSDAFNEWAQDNLCSECQDKTLDDGEGYDGLCGNCADRAEKDVCTQCDEPLHEKDRELGLCPGCQDDEETETPAPSYSDDGTLSHREWVQQNARNERLLGDDNS